MTNKRRNLIINDGFNPELAKGARLSSVFELPVISFIRNKIKASKDDKWDIYYRIAKRTLLGAVLIFVCIYIIDRTDLPSKMGIVNSENSKDWLDYSIGFFGAIAASFMGFIGGIISVSMTIEKQNEFRKEDNRRSVLPLIETKDKIIDKMKHEGISPIVDVRKNKQTLICLSFSFQNVGQREMYDIWVGEVERGGKMNDGYYKMSPILYKGDEYSECLMSAIECLEDETKISVLFKVYFKDCYDNWYFQKIVGKGSGGYNIGYNITSFDIDSAPKLVDKNSLPGAIKG